MIIKNIPPTQDLFRITDVVSEGLAKRIVAHDWLNEPLTKQEAQEEWTRWMVGDHYLLREMDAQLTLNINQINQACNTNFFVAEGTRMWIDPPGFTVPIHLDGVVGEIPAHIKGVPQAMQTFWVGQEETGTTFYAEAPEDIQAAEELIDNKTKVRYRFPFEKNTAYFMINTPTLWHGMLVPSKDYRFTTYTYFR